ncbi:MAG: ATP-binding cassette domain-containing protein [Deltaproteobacteria bacterium]|nr:ATP-binding cassette domain-containing protein [Deltaproteobacteria bacterium]
MDTPALAVRGLRVALPDGRVLIDGVDLSIKPGEVVVLLGGSGAGKSTFARVLFEREELAAAGFDVMAAQLDLDREQLGLVPQRGALFDHLDVRGNLEIALRHSGGDVAEAPRWLERVGLDPALADAPVTALSGGQAQRVAVARVLASKRKLLFLDEPSVGLDPHRVRVLARLIREQVAKLGISAIVVTHDVALAAGVADRLFLLSLADRKLEPLFADRWPGPVEDHPDRGTWLLELEAAIVDHLDAHGDKPAPAGSKKPPRRSLIEPVLRPFTTAFTALVRAPGQLVRHPRDFGIIAKRVLLQTLLRPLVFYAIVSTLIGYTVLFVISKVGGAGVRPDALLRQIGGSYVVALAPALSALLFVAASGSATNAWLGSMGLTKQTLALDALGVDRRSYLWAPAWVTAGLAYLLVAGIFAFGMIAGGLLVCRGYHVPHAWELLTADFVDPRPERVRYALRAGFLVWMYAWGIASDVVAKGGANKPEADSVTRGMTASVVACTLWVVAWELLTVIVMFGVMSPPADLHVTNGRPSRPAELSREGSPLVRTRWTVRYRGGFVREVGETELVGPYQKPGACVGRIVIGQQLLDHGVTQAIGKQIDAELRGESVFPVGDYQKLKGLAVRWAELAQHPDDKAMVGDAPHGYVRVGATVVFDRVEVPIVVALVPEGAGVHFRLAARAELSFDNRAMQWLSDKIGGDKLASRLARRQIDDVLLTTLAPPPPFELDDHQTLQFTYCDGPIEIADAAYGALPFAVRFQGNVAHVPLALPPPTRDALSIDLTPDALNGLLHELWRTGWLDRRLAEAGLDRMFNSDPTVAEFLSVRIGPATLALAPVVTPHEDKLRVAADARVPITDEGHTSTGRVYGALDAAFPSGVDLGALELTCEQTRETLVPCYGDLVAAMRDRGAAFHGALTEQLRRLVTAIFAERQLAGLPADVTIHTATPSLVAGALHLKLDASIQ